MTSKQLRNMGWGCIIGGAVLLALGLTACEKESPICRWLDPGEYRIQGVRSSGPANYCAPSVDFVAELDSHGIQPTEGTDCTTKEQADQNTCDVTATTDCPNGFYLVYMLSIRRDSISGGRMEVGYRGTPAVCYYAVTYEKVEQPDGGSAQSD